MVANHIKHKNRQKLFNISSHRRSPYLCRSLMRHGRHGIRGGLQGVFLWRQRLVRLCRHGHGIGLQGQQQWKTHSLDPSFCWLNSLIKLYITLYNWKKLKLFEIRFLGLVRKAVTNGWLNLEPREARSVPSPPGKNWSTDPMGWHLRPIGPFSAHVPIEKQSLSETFPSERLRKLWWLQLESGELCSVSCNVYRIFNQCL